MQLSLKKSLNKWVPVEVKKGEPKVELLIDYPSRDQQQELDDIIYGNQYSGNAKQLRFSRLLVKYTVKDWKGIVDENDKPIKCIIENNALEDDLWWSLVKNPIMPTNLFLVIYPEVDWTETDKKK